MTATTERRLLVGLAAAVYLLVYFSLNNRKPVSPQPERIFTVALGQGDEGLLHVPIHEPSSESSRQPPENDIVQIEAPSLDTYHLPDLAPTRREEAFAVTLPSFHPVQRKTTAFPTGMGRAAGHEGDGSVPGSTSGSADVTDPVEVTTDPPVYPELARKRSLEGSVRLAFDVHTNGATGGITILESSGHPILDEAAMAAVARWTFKSGTQSGQPVISRQIRRFTFRLAP